MPSLALRPAAADLAPVRTRGSARVGIMWLVAVVVLLMFALFLLFSQQSTLSDQKESLAQEQARTKEEKEGRFKEGDGARALSELVGFYDPSNADPRSNLEAAKAAFAEFKASFPDMEAAVNIERSLTAASLAYQAKLRNVRDLEARIKTLESELGALRQSQTQALADKDRMIAELTREKSDEAAKAAEMQRELQDRLARAVEQVSSTDAERRTAAQESEARAYEAVKREQSLQARIDQMRQLTAFAQSPNSDLPDARVLQVSEPLGMAWLDIGANNRLARGTRFRIESGLPGSKRLKAWGEVIDVEASSARVKLQDIVDRFDPVVPGDVAVNPVYDPSGERSAVLVGRFSGNYDRKNLEAMLQRLGIRVEEQVDIGTNYLIVGSEIHTDEFGEPLETPLQPSDLPEYKKAESLGVQIVPLDDVRAYFKL
jgi:hypothetical protein